MSQVFILFFDVPWLRLGASTVLNFSVSSFFVCLVSLPAELAKVMHKYHCELFT